MKIRRKISGVFGAIFAFFVASCSSSSDVILSYDEDISKLLSRFEEFEPIDDLPESSRLQKGQEIEVFSSTDKKVASEAELEKETERIANQYFYRVVGQMKGNSDRRFVFRSFSSDVKNLCEELRIRMAIWEIIDEKSTYHEGSYTPGYYIGNNYISGSYSPGYTTTTSYYKAYFLVPIPKSDRDAWSLGLNVRDLTYEDRGRLSRNTGVLVTNVYDGKPAFNANVRPDYVITGVNGNIISTMDDWERETSNIKPGVPVKLTTAHYGHSDYFSEVITPVEIPPETTFEVYGDAKNTTLTLGTADDFVFVEGGSFQMGNEDGYGTKPVHEVSVSSFYMCRHEVTQAEWIAIMETNPSYCQGSKFDENYYPVEQVTFNDVITYCNKRSEAEGLTPAYKRGDSGWTCNWQADGYRLPTEAEWEFAARGGNGGRDKNFAGSTKIDEVGWTGSNAGHPREIMMKKPNKLGIYDLTGNVSELCWDRYDLEYYSKRESQNPKGPFTGSSRVVRGGSAYDNSLLSCSVYSRAHQESKSRNFSTGFRVVRSIPKEKVK